MSLTYRAIKLRVLIGIVLASVAFSCKQYEYVSPLPGVLEVRLRVLNTRQDVIPFGPRSSYFFSIDALNLVNGNVKQAVYADLYAFRRNPDGDPFNALDLLARDSALVLGQAYVPPMTFLGLNISIKNWGSEVSIIRNQIPIPNQIIVSNPPLPAPPPPQFFQLPEPPQTLSIHTSEGGKTVVTVTFDMDSSLVRRSEDFQLHPYFFISSVQTY